MFDNNFISSFLSYLKKKYNISFTATPADNLNYIMISCDKDLITFDPQKSGFTSDLRNFIKTNFKTEYEIIGLFDALEINTSPSFKFLIKKLTPKNL